MPEIVHVSPSSPVKPTTNGAAPQVVTPPPAAEGGKETPAVTPPPPAAHPDAERLAKMGEEMAKRERRFIAEQRKAAEQKKGWETERGGLLEMKKALDQARLNPSVLAQKLWGEKWLDVLTETRLNGVPPAQLIASEVEQVEARFKAQLEERDKAAQAAQKGQEEARVASARQQMKADAQAFVKASTKEHGVLLASMPEDAAAGMLAQRIESEYFRTEKRDSETGEILTPGRLLSMKEAAEQVESEVLALVEKVTASESFKARAAAKAAATKEAAPLAGGPKLERRNTLSNDLTGLTRPTPTARITEAERRARAIAAFNGVHKSDE